MTANNGRDTAHVINFLAGQSFSTGRIGMLGGSAAGVTQLAVATLDPRDQPAALKAIAPMSAPTGLYDFIHHDGVLDYLKGPVDSTNYYSAWVGTDGSPVAPAVDSSGSTPTVSPGSPLALVQHAGCAAEEQAAVDDPSGAYTDYFERHDLRGGAGKVRVPTLLLRGLDDQEVETTTETGFWDRIPASTPHKLVIGQFEHALPWSHGMFPNWQRADCEVMLGAWFDHWLKDADNDVTSWPAVQVQDTAGQWRVEPNWPTVGGPVGQLALDPGAGTLGENTKPDSAASYFELSDANSSTDPQGPTPGLTFMTPELTGPLRLTGQMEADLWLETTGPDANVVVGLERFLPDGHGGFVKEDYSFDQNAGDSSVIGMRSTRFRDPILDGWFRQRTPKDPPLSDLAGLAHNPFELKIRLFPQDIVVPTGGKLRLTISGAYIRDSGVGSKVHPSSNARVTVISNREHPSVLRFGMPHPQAPLMNVREKTNLDEQGKTPLASTPGRIGDGDGGGLATRLVWGRYPTRDEVIGPVRPPARLRQ
jgi:predicted acyl esterase